MEVDRAKGRGSLTRSEKLAQRVRYDNRPVGHYLTSDRRSLKYQAGTYRTKPLDAWKSVGDRIKAVADLRSACHVSVRPSVV